MVVDSPAPMTKQNAKVTFPSAVATCYEKEKVIIQMHKKGAQQVIFLVYLL